jgi:hypothetical protein
MSISCRRCRVGVAPDDGSMRFGAVSREPRFTRAEIFTGSKKPTYLMESAHAE